MQPHSPESHIVSPADLAACRQMIRDGSKTFYTASQLLPQRVCDAARALYAFCRVADDAVDQSTDSQAAVAGLQKRLDAIYRQAPDPHPADRAFADVARRYAIPRALPAALIEGFAWDAEGHRYENLNDITAYAVRVAGTVGAMMSLIMQVRDPAAIARACDLGVAMQFTNIARDVGEDARNGRLYLPRQWLSDVGLHADDWLANPRHSPQLGSVIARLLAQADHLYARAATGISLLPASCRPAIQAARLLYAGIGHEVERNFRDSVTRRAAVPPARKLALLAAALAASLAPARRDAEAPLDEARFIIEAVVAAAPSRAHPRGLIERAVWVAELFARLEKSRP